MPKKIEPTAKLCSDDVLVDVWENSLPMLSPEVTKALRGTFFFSHCTSVQKKAVPVFIDDSSNIVVEACTGSGKTMAFLIPIVERALRANRLKLESSGGVPCLHKEVCAVILSPTVTLAKQTFEHLTKLVHALPFNLRACLFGSKKSSDDATAFQRSARGGGCIISSTPSALLAILKDHPDAIHFQGQSAPYNTTLVIDEADVVMEKLSHQVTELMNYIPISKASFGLFGATASSSKYTQLFMEKYMGAVNTRAKKKAKLDPKARKCVVVMDGSSTQMQLLNRYVWCKASTRLSVLLHFLTQHSTRRHFVFFNTTEHLLFTRRALDEMGDKGSKVLPPGIHFDVIHGGMKEHSRLAALQRYMEDPHCVLLCTDTNISFGIDIQNVDYIIHYDIPLEPRIYVHRVGRTARMGVRGSSIMLLPECLREVLGAEGGYLEQLQQKLPMQQLELKEGTLFDCSTKMKQLLADDPDLAAAAAAALKQRAVELLASHMRQGKTNQEVMGWICEEAESLFLPSQGDIVLKLLE